MKSDLACVDEFQKSYVDPGFERDGIFKLIQQQYHPQEVLYPGCSIHLTPAFYFPHVIFVDRDPGVQAFFANHEKVLELVKRRKEYRRSPYIHYIHQDFTDPLPVRESQFDLLLALYTAGVAKACSSHLKIGGLLLSNNFHNDALEAYQQDDLVLIAMIQKRRGKYQFDAQEPGGALKVSDPVHRTRRYLRQTSDGVEYIDQESYYLFRKTA